MATRKSPRFLRPQRPLGQGWEDDTRREPQRRIDARPSNVVYDPRTGPGTGVAARRTHIRNSDGSFTPISGLGAPHNSAPKPLTGDQMLAQRGENFKKAVADGTAGDKITKFNELNPKLHMGADGNIVPKLDAEKNAGSPAQSATPDSTPGKGAMENGATRPPPFNNVSGQGQSMRGVSRDQSSAQGDWQGGAKDTRYISSQYGKGYSVDVATGPRQPGKFDNSAYEAKPSAPGTSQTASTPATPPKTTPAVSATPPKLGPNGELPPSALSSTPQPQYPKGSLEQRAQSLGNAARDMANFEGARAIANGSGAGNLVKQDRPAASATVAAVGASDRGMATPKASAGAFINAGSRPQPPAASPSAAPAPAPGYFAQKAAANPGGIISKVGEATQMLGNSINRGLNNAATAGANIANTAKTLAGPLANATANAATAAGNAVGSALLNKAEQNPGGIAARIVGQDNTAAAPSQPAVNPRVEAAKQDEVNKEVSDTGGEGGGGNSDNAEEDLPKIAGTRADGGPVKKGSAYLVGEKGPEIVIPQKDATVIPNHAISSLFLAPRQMPAQSAKDKFKLKMPAGMAGARG